MLEIHPAFWMIRQILKSIELEVVLFNHFLFNVCGMLEVVLEGNLIISFSMFVAYKCRPHLRSRLHSRFSMSQWKDILWYVTYNRGCLASEEQKVDKIDDNLWKWMKMDECGWYWMKVDKMDDEICGVSRISDPIFNNMPPHHIFAAPKNTENLYIIDALA